MPLAKACETNESSSPKLLSIPSGYSKAFAVPFPDFPGLLHSLLKSESVQIQQARDLETITDADMEA